jgi:glycosyltransferase involved in cell wall biosynthesis
MTALSVVLITKNQEWNVARLVESVLEECGVPPSEVVLVDSASTDNTIPVAMGYPITLIRLLLPQRLTAAMGRYVGCMQSHGQYVLFLDGDMELCRGWLCRALEVMKRDARIASITGEIIDRPKATPRGDRLTLPAPVEPVMRVDAKMVGGAALFRRSVLEEVGTFNPYLYGDEEPELCIRIRHRGYRVVKIVCPIAFHYTDPGEEISTLIARWRRNLLLGGGQNLRYLLGKKVFWMWFSERPRGIVPLLVLLIGVLALVPWVSNGHWGFFAGLVAAVIIAAAVRKRSVYRACYSLLQRLLIVDGTVRGFFLKPLSPERHPVRFEVIKQHVDISDRAWAVAKPVESEMVRSVSVDGV